MPSLPLPLVALRVVEGLSATRGFLVGGMFTPDYADRAERLRSSCERFGLPYALFELPSVHRSVSPRGTADEALTKANFIHALLERYRRPLLYLDIDCLFCADPVLIDRLAAEGTDLAIFNWAAEPDNEAFVPVDVELRGEVRRDRYFMFSHRIKRHAPEQLVASGCVQLHADSPGARRLLEDWQQAIRRFPGCADDQCLSFAFNNRDPGAPRLRARWLPREYARIASWITVKPVIDHPEHPVGAAAFKPMPDDEPQKWFYVERSEPVEARYSESSIIDAREGLLYELADGKLVLSGTIEDAFHVAWGTPAREKISVTEIEE